MSFQISYPNTPYYLETNKLVDISINTTGVEPVGGVTYTISPVLPLTLAFNGTTGYISGTPTFADINPLVVYTVNALNTSLSTVATTTLSILIDFLPVFSYPNTPYTLTINKPYINTTQIKPTYTFFNKVGTIYTLESSPSLTNIGLTLNQSNGVITGTPIIQSPKISYTIRANNNNIIYDTVIQISVEIPPTIIYPNTIYTLTQGETVSIIPNQLSGNTNSVYSISCKLPAGLTFNSVTGEISGTPTVLTTPYKYTITVTDSIGDAYATLILSVIKTFLAPPVFGTLPSSSEEFITNPDVQMRRKAEILQYKQNSGKLTKQQYLSLLAKGNGPYAKRVWATQGDAFTSSNISGLPQSGSIIACNSPSSIIYKPSSASNVPGPVINLFLNPNVQPNGYREPNRTKIFNGHKWPYSNGN